MRNPFAALLSTLIGVAFGVPGLSALVFVGLLAWRPGLALTWAQLVAAHTPIPLESFLELRPNGVFLVRSQWGTFGAGTLLSLIGYFTLCGARESLRPADQSSGGLAQVLIKTQCPCVGAVLEGELTLLKAPKPDQVFRVSLLCRHIHSLADDRRKRTIVWLSQDIEIKITQVVEGWQLPFRFEVPADARQARYSTTSATSWAEHQWTNIRGASSSFRPTSGLSARHHSRSFWERRPSDFRFSLCALRDLCVGRSPGVQTGGYPIW